MSPLIPAPTLEEVRNGTAVLQTGQKGNAVAFAQLRLGVFDDGGFGQITNRAVTAFQQSEGITVEAGNEGKVDQLTLAALERVNADTLTSLDKIDKRNKKVHLHPKFRKKLATFAETLAARGMDVLITDGFRSFAEQDRLFEQGRSTPGDIVTGSRGGFSNHNYGLAVDMYPVIQGQVLVKVPNGPNRARFLEIQQAIIDEAEGLGLFSGVHFTNLVDTPHVQLFPQQVFKPSASLQVYNANNRSFDAVWAEATRILNGNE